MLDREAAIQQILSTGVVAIIRARDPAELVRVAEALAAGGVEAIEFTLTTPGALGLIEATRGRLGERVLLGAGSVLDPETARACILAGAQFIVSPTLNLEVVRLTRRYGALSLPGALTPTEILAAWEAGADLVKIFPASAVGPRYLREVLAPLPQVRLVPTGGVTLENAGEFIAAGAAAIGVGSALVDARAVQAGDFAAISERARRFAETVRRART